MLQFKKYFAILGIIIVIAHLTYYFIRPYSFILFILGFGVIYLLFVLPLKKVNEREINKETNKMETNK